MLATLLAIVGQTLRNANSLAEANVTLAARIRSMDAANDLLIAERWEGAPIRDLVERALAPFRLEGSDHIRIDGPAVSVPPKLVLGLALALHELATNAVKYGALSTQDGRVDICWAFDSDTRTDRLRFRWKETDGPPVSPPTRFGFGSMLIQRVLAHEIDGTVELDYHPDGVVFEAIATIPEDDTEAPR